MTIGDMGTQREYIESGGFSAYLYLQRGEAIVAPNGVKAKVVEKIYGTRFDGLPILSNTGEVYLKRNPGGEIVQARIYRNRRPVCDFDLDHAHVNKGSGERFAKGVVHVQTFVRKPDGTWRRQKHKARNMTDEEVVRYGPLLRKVRPGLKLRPDDED